MLNTRDGYCLNRVLTRHQSLFSPGLGEIKGTTAKILLKENAQSKFFSPRPVPNSMKTKMQEELNKPEREKLISKGTHSEWAALLVVEFKENGKVRLCGNFKVTINSQM